MKKIYNLFIISAEIRWLHDDGGLTIKIKAKQSLTSDWFGIGFSTGRLMVMYLIYKFQLYLQGVFT